MGVRVPPFAPILQKYFDRSPSSDFNRIQRCAREAQHRVLLLPDAFRKMIRMAGGFLRRGRLSSASLLGLQLLALLIQSLHILLHL